MSRQDNESRTQQGRHLTHRPGSESPDPAARLAHELANLLDGSMRNMGMVRRSLTHEPAEGEESDELVGKLESVDQAMRQMAVLLRRFMSESRQPAQLHRDSRTLEETVAHVVRLLEPAARQRGIEVRVAVEDGAKTVPAGPLYPIVANAVRNSIDALGQRAADDTAAREPGLIDVAAQRMEDELVLTVRDNGPGIDPTLLGEEGLFEVGRTTKTAGHGLGLSLCLDIADHLSGSLRLHNVEPRGALLTFRVPLARLTGQGEQPDLEDDDDTHEATDEHDG